MPEDERQTLIETVAEAYGGLSEAAFKLRRELGHDPQWCEKLL